MRSWKRIEQPSDYLLNHELGHFNLTEIYRRLAMDSIKSLPLFKIHNIDSIVSHFSSKKAELQKIYDKETDHSLIKESQKEWDKSISEKLNSLDY